MARPKRRNFAIRVEAKLSVATRQPREANVAGVARTPTIGVGRYARIFRARGQILTDVKDYLTRFPARERLLISRRIGMGQDRHKLGRDRKIRLTGTPS